MKQLTIITNNEMGDLAVITGALAEKNINIKDIEADGHCERSVIVITVSGDSYDEALRILQDNTDYQIVTEDALVIRIMDRPGALAGIATRLKDASVDVRSIHIIQRGDDHSIASIVVNDRQLAKSVLSDVLA